MGMGNYACFAEVIDDSFVKEICPQELGDFKDIFSEVDATIDDFATALDYESGIINHLSEDENERVCALFEELYHRFKERTQLELSLSYHGAEDRGDEVDGAFWTVEGVYQRTPAGEKYKDKIVRKSWTVYG